MVNDEPDSENAVSFDLSYRCPYCNLDLTGKSNQYAQKHIARCKKKSNPYTYSLRRPGRPKEKRCWFKRKKSARVLFNHIQELN